LKKNKNWQIIEKLKNNLKIKNLKSLELEVAKIVNKINCLKKWNFKCEQKKQNLQIGFFKIIEKIGKLKNI